MSIYLSDGVIVKRLLKGWASLYTNRLLISPFYINPILLSQAQATAAAALINSSMSLTIAAAAPAHALNSFFAQAFGKNDDVETQNVYQCGLIIVFITAGISTAIVRLSPYIFILAGSPSDALEATIEYLNYALGGIFFTLLPGPSHSLMVSRQAKRYPIIINGCALISYVISGYFLTFRNNLGSRGVGLAFTIRGLVASLMTEIVMMSHPDFRKFHWTLTDIKEFFRNPQILWNKVKALWPSVKNIFKITFPSIVHSLSELFLFVVTAAFAGHFDAPGLEIHLVYVQYLTLSLMAWFALSQAITIQAGEELGASALVRSNPQALQMRLANVRRISHAGIALSQMVSTTSLVFTVAFPNPFIRIYVKPNTPGYEGIVRHLQQVSLPVAATTAVVDGTRNTAYSIPKTFKIFDRPTYLNAATLWLIVIPLAAGLTYGANLDTDYIHISILIGFIAATIVMLIYVRQLINRELPLPQPTAEIALADLSQASADQTQLKFVMMKPPPLQPSIFDGLNWPLALFRSCRSKRTTTPNTDVFPNESISQMRLSMSIEEDT